VLAIALVVRVPIFAGIGDRIAHPVAFASVGTRYEHGIGNLEVDLQDVSFPAGKTHVKATLGIGDLLVRVPKNVTLVVDAHAGTGKVNLLGRTDDGTSVNDRLTDPGAKGTARILELDARVGLGEVEVQRG
jgi:predicted membrane protein